MTFTEALAKQQSVIADCHFRYCEYRDKLDYLMEQIKICDPWDLSEEAKLNQGIGAAMMDVRVAWADWEIAIDALAHIPTSGGADTAIMDEWREAVVLMPPGYRVLQRISLKRARRLTQLLHLVPQICHLTPRSF